MASISEQLLGAYESTSEACKAEDARRAAAGEEVGSCACGSSDTVLMADLPAADGLRTRRAIQRFLGLPMEASPMGSDGDEHDHEMAGGVTPENIEATRLTMESLGFTYEDRR